MSLSRSATTVTIAADASTSPRLRRGKPGPLRGFDPTPRFSFRQRAVPVMFRHDTVAAVNITAHEAQAGVTLGVHRDHRVRDNPVGIAFLHRSQACPCAGGGRGGAARWWEISPPWYPESPEYDGRRQPPRCAGSSLQRSSPPSLSGWRRTGPLVLRRDDYHPAGASISSCARPSVRGSCPPFIEAQIPE
jgi:hypothetical protein